MALTSSTAARGRVDQQTTCNDGGSAQVLFYEPIAQRFVPMAPNLIAVEVMLGRFNAPYSDTLTMRLTEESVGGAFVAAMTQLVPATAPLAWYRFEFATPFPVVPGAPYVIAIDATNPSFGWQHQYELPPRCSYPDGEEIVLGTPVYGLDASFRTYSLCGNGVVDVGEECDDGNTNGQDGCTNHCTVCGNGTRRAPEECDDGNRTNGDGLRRRLHAHRLRQRHPDERRSLRRRQHLRRRLLLAHLPARGRGYAVPRRRQRLHR